MIFQNRVLVPVLCFAFLVFMVNPQKRQAFKLLLGIAIAGMVIDSFLSLNGVFVFPYAQLIPLWLCVLWIAFAMTLPYGFAFVGKLTPLIQSIIGVAASFTYLIGLNLGAVEYTYSLILTQILLAIIWGGLLPLAYLYINTIKRVSS